MDKSTNNLADHGGSTSTIAEKKPPSDNFFLVHTCSLLLGFMTMAPMFIMGTASGYWLDKFKDPSQDPSDKHRTTLQVYYQTAATIATNGPMLLFSTFWTVYGHKVSPMKRTIWSQVLFTALYVIFTMFTKINTDTWQAPFFAIAMVMLVLQSAMMATLQMSTVVLIAKLPRSYLLFYFFGQGGTFVLTILQIICLAVTDDQSTTGLIYFGTITFIMVLTYVVLMLCRRTELFEYYELEKAVHQRSEMLSWSESVSLLKKIWPCILVFSINFFSASCIHPGISTLVMSKYKDTEWSDKYFTPVCAYFVSELFSSLGRFLSKGFSITQSNKWIYIALSIVRLLTQNPLSLFLNINPTKLPVLLGEDWEFVLFMAYFGCVTGFVLNICPMSLKNLAPERNDVALKLYNLSIAIGGILFSVNGMISIKLANL